MSSFVAMLRATQNSAFIRPDTVAECAKTVPPRSSHAQSVKFRLLALDRTKACKLILRLAVFRTQVKVKLTKPHQY